MKQSDKKERQLAELCKLISVKALFCLECQLEKLVIDIAIPQEHNANSMWSVGAVYKVVSERASRFGRKLSRDMINWHYWVWLSLSIEYLWIQLA